MRYRVLAAGGVTAALVATAAWAAPFAGATEVPAGAAGVAAKAPSIAGSVPLADTAELQKIADANGGLRAHGRPGFKASIDFLKGKLDAAGLQTSVQTFSFNGATGYNLIAEWPYGDANNVIMSGAHVDSVTAGAGINDNGSGTAAVLETALAAAKADLRPAKRMRFGFWGAEELGLVGSRKYVQSLSTTDRQKINAYLNFDMVGTKNITAWGIYREGPDLAAKFTAFFAGRGIPTRTINPVGMSDHSSFADAGIKVTGISSEADLNHLEPCYHQACDTGNNVDATNLGLATTAITTVMWDLAGATAAPAPGGTPQPTATAATPTGIPTTTATKRPRRPIYPW